METTATYISDLAEATYRETKQNHADRVTPTYVRGAADRINSGRRSRLNEVMISIGGILVGVGVSGFPALLAASTLNTGQAVLVAVAGTIGGVMMATGFLRR